jgi:hypothetical protein
VSVDFNLRRLWSEIDRGSRLCLGKGYYRTKADEATGKREIVAQLNSQMTRSERKAMNKEAQRKRKASVAAATPRKVQAR